MITIKENIDTKHLNTFKISVKAKRLITFDNEQDLKEVARLISDEKKYIILGGGSNILFSTNFDATIIKPEIKGIEITEQSSDFVKIKAFSGEVWDNFVEFCVSQQLAGIENLSYIPGSVGASVVQNIGAYGAEVKNSVFLVKAFNLKDNRIEYFSNADCNFEYRNSIFKQNQGKYIIISVEYLLTKNHIYNLSYPDLQKEIKKYNEINLKNIRNCIIQIRSNKLPDPEKIGNAGSFFKNPIISAEKANYLRKKYPKMVQYTQPDGLVKIAAAWLIDSLGYKGKCYGGACVHEKQALVIINKNSATADDIINLAKQIIVDVKNVYDITLEPEVIIV